MKRWPLSVFVFLLVATTLLLAGGAVAQTQCDAADALFNAQLYDAAQTNYTALLQQNPNLTCASNGSLEIQRAQAKYSYELGRAYENAGQLKEARDAYVAALVKYPNYSLAQEALENVSDNKFAAVQTLANLGYYTEAADRLKTVVEDNPGIEVPNNLTYLPGGNIPLWGYLRSLIQRWGQPFAELAIFLLGLYVMRWRIWPWIKGLCEPRLDIQEFDNGATGLEIGKGMMAMAEESLMRLGQEEHAWVHLSAGPTEKLSIPADIKEVSPQIKALSNLIEWILPSNVITVSGYLEKPGIKGAGLTLSMVTSRGDILGNITIWQKDYDPTATQSSVMDKDPVPYYCLAEPAAIWALFQLNDPSKIKRGIFCRTYYGIKKLFGNVENSEKFTPLGTDNWQSYAYFRAGVRWELEGEKGKARQLFVDAQNQDMNNYGALFNLGYLDIEDEICERAIERLRMARDATKPTGEGKYPEKSVWYLSMYQMAAAYHYKSIMLRESKEDLDKAKKYLDKAGIESLILVTTIDAVIKELQNESQGENEKKLKKFLESIEPNANIMHASILVDQGKKLEDGAHIKEIESKYFKLTPRVRYNLACYYSIVGDKAEDERAKVYKKALYQLKYALEGGGDIIQWAQKDPSLKGVREFKETKEDFAKLVRSNGEQPAQNSAGLPLADIAIIKEAYAKQLKEQGIVSHCDLILKADTPSSRKELAKKLDISTQLLHRWALLADLMRIVGNIQNANLLEEAGVGSLKALRNVSDPCELANLLNQINKAMSLVSQTPSIETVRQWVQEAKKTELKVH